MLETNLQFNIINYELISESIWISNNTESYNMILVILVFDI